MNFVIFLRNFDEILSEFHEEKQKITVILDTSCGARPQARALTWPE